MNREAIWSALFTRIGAATWPALSIGGSTTWAMKSRKLLHWNEVPNEAKPAFFQRQMGAKVVRQRGLPAKWVLKGELYIYVATLAQQNETLIPSQQLNPIMDAVQAQFAALPGDGTMDRCTLGGLVDECKIEGEVEDFDGDLGDIGVLIVPVEITVPY